MINVSYRIEPISVQVLLTALNDGHIKQWRNLEIGRDVMQADRASYITSIMAGIPILPLVFDGTKSPWIVLDGEKRFSLLLGFFHNKYPVFDSQYFSVGGEKYYRDLPMYLKRRFISTKIPCIVINPPTPEEAIANIKKRIKINFD